MLKTHLLAAVAAGAIAAGSASSVFAGNLISFDPDGAGGAYAASSVSAFDFLPGNTLYVPTSPTSGTIFVQARLGALIGTSNPTVSVPTINQPGGFEITAVAQFNVNVTPLGATAVQFTGSTPGTLAMYYDDSPNASDLTGNGFYDGDKIFEAPIIDVNAVVGLSAFPLLFDQSGADDFGSLLSNIFVGGGTLTTGAPSTLDASFFGSNVLSMMVNTGLKAPFSDTDPSQQFNNGGVIPNLGAINGSLGSDWQMQNDATGSFTAVPEPATLALMGLAGLTLAGKRRRKA